MALIEVVDLKKEYRNGGVSTLALNGISFQVKKGEFVAIMGPSGSGKSTLMHIMGFLDRPTSGIYRYEGKSIDELSDDQLARIRNKKMGFVFQAYNLLPRINVFENVRLPLVYSGIKKEFQKKMVIEAIKSVGLSHRIDFYPNQLSGGEQQRVAIARALVNHPSVIFADEPTGNLDSATGKVIMGILAKLHQEEKRTIVVVTHDPNIANYSKEVVNIKDGEIIHNHSQREKVLWER